VASLHRRRVHFLAAPHESVGDSARHRRFIARPDRPLHLAQPSRQCGIDRCGQSDRSRSRRLISCCRVDENAAALHQKLAVGECLNKNGVSNLYVYKHIFSLENQKLSLLPPETQSTRLADLSVVNDVGKRIILLTGRSKSRATLLVSG